MIQIIYSFYIHTRTPKTVNLFQLFAIFRGRGFVAPALHARKGVNELADFPPSPKKKKQRLDPPVTPFPWASTVTNGSAKAKSQLSG